MNSASLQWCSGSCRKIEAAFKPVSFKVIDESHKHAGHSGNPSGHPDAETHFR